jgi:hypothetical protein
LATPTWKRTWSASAACQSAALSAAPMKADESRTFTFGRIR